MKLHEYIVSKLNTPFEWGINDCMLFTIGWVEISSGKKYLPKNIWKNEFEAVKLTNKKGGLIKVFDETFNRIEPNYAVDGDICVLDGVASIFSGSQVVSVGKSGLSYKKRTEAQNAWTY